MQKILMVYIEPTPYIVGLIKNIVLQFHSKIDVLFLGENLSQNWDLCFEKQWMLPPKNKLKKIYFIILLLLKNKYDIIHLAGWGDSLFWLLAIFGKLFSIPIVMESDTPMPYKTKFWKHLIKRLFYPRLFSLVSLFLPGGSRQAKYIEYYGVKSERIIPVQMTVDVTYIRKYAETFLPNDRQKTREVYSISDKDIVFLFVGRLVKQKGIGNL